MTERIDPAALEQVWLHSHEEDTPTETVYRPAGHRLPPARGRTGFELKPDRTAIAVGPGRGDRSAATAGTWELDEAELRLRLEDGSMQVLPIVAAEADRLVIRKRVEG